MIFVGSSGCCCGRGREKSTPHRMIVGLRTDGNEYVAQNAALRTETSHGRQLAILGSLSSDLSPQPAQVAPVFGSRPGRHSASRLGGTGRLLPSHLVGSGAQVLAFNPVPILLDPEVRSEHLSRRQVGGAQVRTPEGRR